MVWSCRLLTPEEFLLWGFDLGLGHVDDLVKLLDVFPHPLEVPVNRVNVISWCGFRRFEVVLDVRKDVSSQVELGREDSQLVQFVTIQINSFRVVFLL